MRYLAIIVACIGATVAVAAQQATFPPDTPPKPTFRLTTRLVEVGVVVRKDGKPVTRLEASDFRVFDNGEEVPVVFFHTDSGAAPGGAPVPATEGEFSNRLPARLGTATVILIDRLNTTFEGQVMAREQVVGFLQQLRPEDRVALYVLESERIRVLHDFTSDARSLIRVLARSAGTTSRELAASQERPLPTPQTGDAHFDAETEAWLRNVSRKISAEFVSQRAESTTAALEAIAGHLAGVTGRKNLLWVSSAFPRVMRVDGFLQTRSHEIGRATTALNDANVAVYPIDARGLVGAFTGASARQGPTPTTMAATQPNIDTMETLAEATGGRAFYNTNDIGGAIRRAIDDGNATYVLGYYPTHNRWDASFHKLTVKVSHPGVEVRHRQGYLALPGPSLEAASRDERLGAALRSPLEGTGLGVAVRVERRAPAPGNVLALIITIGPRGVTLQPQGEKWAGAVDVVIAQDLPGGTSKTSAYFTINLSIGAEQRERALREGLVLTREVDLQDDAHRLRIVALDLATGTVGSLVVPATALREAAR